MIDFAAELAGRNDEKERPSEQGRGANRFTDSETNTQAETLFYSKEKKETDGGIRFGIQEDGTAIFPTARPSAKKELPAEPERGAAKKEAIEEDENRNLGNAARDYEEEENIPWIFSNKEIMEMPQKYRKLFRTEKLRAYIRKRIRGNSVNYEARCRMAGIDISASGTTVEEAKKRFLEKLHTADQGEPTTLPTKYQDFCLYYFEKFRKRRVAAETYRLDLGRSKNHIFPAIGNKALRSITPSDCQILLDSLTERGMGKTADEVFSLMNDVFKGAIAHNLIDRNPLSTVIHEQHERESGTALTYAEEAALLNCDSKYRLQFIIILYTGMRPCEYSFLQRKGNMLITRNRKRKNGKIEYKRIPISPMLAPHIGDMQEFHFAYPQTLYKNLLKIVPGHPLYDLRTTFCTRIRECGVLEAAVKEMMGHSEGKLMNAYTDLSDEFLYAEAAKISYDLPPILPPNP